MRSVKEDGYTFDMGSHIIFSRNKEAVAFMLRALGANHVTNRRNTTIIYKGMRVKYPFENGLGDLPKEEAFECLSDLSRHPPAGRGASLLRLKISATWMHYRFGKAITEKYLYPYNRKIWDHPPERHGSLLGGGRVPQPPVKDVIKAAMGLGIRRLYPPAHFYYPKTGRDPVGH